MANWRNGFIASAGARCLPDDDRLFASGGKHSPVSRRSTITSGAPVKKKLFSANARLSDHELGSALRALQPQQPRMSKKEAKDLFVSARHEIARNPAKYRQARA
jgi:hypothetical protein